MMARLTPLLANETTAAALLDMPLVKFLDLVARGYLPRRQEIAPGVFRWDVEKLLQLAKGDLARPDGGLIL
jgi:hypothetical protein